METYLNTVTFSQMTDLIRKEFVQNQTMVKPNAGQLFITDPIGKGQGNTKRYDEIDTDTFARNKKEGEKSKKSSVGVGYNVTMTKKRISTEIDISQEMRDENRHADVGTLITSLVHFCPQRIELDQSHVLTFCTATSYTDMDGDTVNLAVGDTYCLINSGHLLKYSTETYSNRVTGDPLFSRGGIEAAEALAISNVVNNANQRRVKNFNVIISSDDPNTVNNIAQFLSATSDPDQNNSGVGNVYKGKYRHIQLPYLATTATGARDTSKEGWWFLAAIGQGAMGWQAYFGVWEPAHMKEGSSDTGNGANSDFSADVWTFGVRAGYGYVAVNGIGIIGSLPTKS